MENIIDCDGTYEVHPQENGDWAVVNGKTGMVRCEFTDQDGAVEHARDLNREIIGNTKPLAT